MLQLTQRLNVLSKSHKQHRHLPHTRSFSTAFTIVELVVVITIIGILATLTIVAYNGIQQQARDKTVLADLDGLDGIETQYGLKNSTAGKSWYSGSGIDNSLNFTPTPGNIIDVVINGTDYCMRAYNPGATTYKSLTTAATKGSSVNACWVIVASAAADAASPAPRSQNLMADFTRWTLSGGATYDNNTKILTLPAAGVAKSPIIRVDSPRIINIGGDFFANSASPYSGFTPQAGYHTGIAYFGNDGVTLALNSSNYTANGCARPFPTGTWAVGDTQCGYNGGPNVIYSSFSFTGSNGTYASPDLIIKNPLMIVVD